MQPTIAHLGIAVTDLDAAAAFYRDVLGVPSRGPEEADGARILHFEFGGTDVELLAPLTSDSPIAKFLAKRGPGIHHVCYRVPNSRLRRRPEFRSAALEPPKSLPTWRCS